MAGLLVAYAIAVLRAPLRLGVEASTRKVQATPCFVQSSDVSIMSVTKGTSMECRLERESQTEGIRTLLSTNINSHEGNDRMLGDGCSRSRSTARDVMSSNLRLHKHPLIYLMHRGHLITD